MDNLFIASPKILSTLNNKKDAVPKNKNAAS